MNFSERYLLLKEHALLIQRNSYLIWLLRERQKELELKIAANNPVLAHGRKIISEKLEALRQEQIDNIKALNFVNAAINEALTEKNILWDNLHKMA